MTTPQNKCCETCIYLGIEEGSLYYCLKYSDEEELKLYPLTLEQIERLYCADFCYLESGDNK